MADQKLRMSELFSRLGTHVYGDRFVGRKSFVKQIQSNCTSRNISIVGLPKIGKTSLAYHSAIWRQKDIDSPRVCVVFYNSGLSKNPNDFFKNLVITLKNQLLSVFNEEEKKKLNELYCIVKEDSFDNTSINNFFETGIKSFAIDIVIIFDEFDKVRTIGFDGLDFGMLRAILGVDNVRGIIVSKRTIYSLENWMNDTSSAPSTFYQLFQGNTIHLKPFDTDSIVDYWDRITPYFEQAGIRINDDFKRKAHFYAGNHPHLLDIYNAVSFDSINDTHTEPSEISIRTTMTDAFHANLEILKSEGLLESAIQAIIGPIRNLPSDHIDRLVEYGFLVQVSSKQKESLLGEHMGYYFKENGLEYSFLGFSEYFTLLMRSSYVNNIDFWEEWSATFRKLRELAECFFISNWGKNWTDSDDMDEVINGLKSFYNKDLLYNIEPSPLLDYLTESLLRDLIRRQWNTFCAVFSPWTERDFFNRYEFVLMLRNHHAHLNNDALSKEDIDKANDYLKEIYHKVSTWLQDETSTLQLIPNKQGTGIPQRKSLVDGEIFEGEIISVNGQKKVKCTSFPFPIKIEGSFVGISENDDVTFTAKSRPNNTDPQKTFWYAINVQRIKN